MADNKVDPFVIQWPRQWIADAEIAPTIKYLNRFLHDLWIRTGGGEDLIDEAVTGSVTESGAVARQRAILNQLANRVQCLEERSAESATLSKLAAINRRIDELIETLIEEIRALKNPEFESKLLAYQSLIKNELELLNARAEEAWVTGIEMGDTE